MYARKSSDMMHIIECVKCVTLHKILHVGKIYMFVYTHSTCVSCVFYILSTYYTGEICHFGWSGFVTYACLFVHLSRPHTEIFQHFYDCSLLQQFPLLIAWPSKTIGTILRITKKKRKTRKLRLKSVVVSVTRGIPSGLGGLDRWRDFEPDHRKVS